MCCEQESEIEFLLIILYVYFVGLFGELMFHIIYCVHLLIGGTLEYFVHTV